MEIDSKVSFIWLGVMVMGAIPEAWRYLRFQFSLNDDF
jgi:hypothetical protein